MATKSKKKKSKQNAVQMVAGVATMGLPAPVQKVASSKLGSLLLLAGAVIAAATGAITISFNGGVPSVTVNEARGAGDQAACRGRSPHGRRAARRGAADAGGRAVAFRPAVRRLRRDSSAPARAALRAASMLQGPAPLARKKSIVPIRARFFMKAICSFRSTSAAVSAGSFQKAWK